MYTFNDLAYNLEQGLVTDIIILDFAKAFDTVSHRKLLIKLKSYGIGTQLIRWIENFLIGRTQTVIVNGAASTRCDVLSGVPQGSVLGPLLFLLYVNDLPESIKSECLLFADDTLLYNTRENKQVLQRDLDMLGSWSRRWQLSFNIDKCSVLSVKDGVSRPDYYLDGRRLENVDSHPYLGIELAYNLKWSRHIDNIVAKASGRLGLLRRALKSADSRTRQQAYNTIVRPILEYGCPVWDPCLTKDIKKLEKVQNRAMRFIFRLRGQVSFSKVRSDTDTISLKDRRKNLRLNLFFKSAESGVIKDSHNDPPIKIHNTRQKDGLYVPSIKTKAYFNSFWPRSARDIRGNMYKNKERKKKEREIHYKY